MKRLFYVIQPMAGSALTCSPCQIVPPCFVSPLTAAIAAVALLSTGIAGAQAKPAKAAQAVKATASKSATVHRASADTVDLAAARTGLPASVTAALRRANVPLSAASFYVVKVGAPQARVSWNAETPMNPASTAKVVTTFAGLQLLGAGLPLADLALRR